MAATKFKKGSYVEWNWGQGTARGKVQDWFTEQVTRTIDGNEVKRNATEENPAYLLEQEDGQRVLKSHSELLKAS